MDWRISDIFRPIDAVAPYHGAYDPWLVAVSVLIAVLAAFVALSVSSRIVASTSWRGRWVWTCAGAFSMGGGIWAMHFIGMLAFSLPCGIDYNPFVTMLSMVPGIIASGIALHLISQRAVPHLGRLIGGSILMGGGIGVMHYSGMAAVESAAFIRYSPGLVTVSVFVAVALAFISLAIRFYIRSYRSSDTLATLIAATIMGLAVAGMHYTAMQASVFFPGAAIESAQIELPAIPLALLIAAITILIAAVALVGSIAGRQSELAAGLKAEIARRQALEQEAEGGRARLQAIFDAVVDAIVTIDRVGCIQQWSSGAQRIFGYAPEEVVGADITILMPEPHRSRHVGYVMSFLTTRNPKIIGTGRELMAVRRDGSEFPIELAVSEVRNGDEVFFTGIMRDITERKRAEADLIRARDAAEAANYAKSQFLATVSHEIRTPMNGVLGMANLLASTPLGDRQQRLVENLSRSGRALLEIINDILDFAKIEAGKFELSAVPFDPRETIAELTDLFAERCATKGLEFIYFVAEEVPEQLIGDPARLRQVLVNLVGNAIKFTERGEILVEVSLSRNDAEAVMLNFAVEDTGIGIPPEQCARVFESFHQVDGSMTRSRGGSGLGLTITQQLVELMSGSISVESELGRGSRFAFTAKFDPLPRDEAISATARQLSRPLRALLADANAVSAHIMSLYLASWQVDTIAVSTVAEAEAAQRDALAGGQPFDVAIIDIKGLGTPALDLATSMRVEKSVRPTELILLVGFDNYMADSHLEALGATAVLPKPAHPSELFQALAWIAADESQRPLMPHALRRQVTCDRPNFGARILVAEDNMVNQEVATGILEVLGCKVVSAPNGRAAFRLAAQEKFDLILMDCEMPIMDGIEATRRIREVEAMEEALPEGGQTGRRVPIIALTAHALNEVRVKCLEVGMDDFLVKPFNEKQMVATLMRWLVPASSTGQAELAAAAEMPPPSAVIDLAVIDGLRALGRNGNSSRLERAVSRFVEVAPSLSTTIRESCDNDDAEALWRAAHSLKSSAGALGAMRLSQRCAEIETQARNTGVDAARGLLLTLDDDLAASIRELRSAVGETHVAT